MDVKFKKSLLLEEVRQIMRVQHYAIKTEQSYIDWIRRFILFHGKRHPADMGESEVAEFLTHLSVNRNVAPATQGQALNALVFLYRKVIKRPLDEIQGIVRSKKKENIPVPQLRGGGNIFFQLPGAVLTQEAELLEDITWMKPLIKRRLK